MSKTFVLTLLGTCTNYAEKFGAPYVRGETLSVIHDSIVGEAISPDPHNPKITSSGAAGASSAGAAGASSAAAADAPASGADVTKAIVDGPDGAGFAVYEKIAQATILMLQQIASGSSTIQINAHSRGAVEAIFVAHEFDRIKKIIRDNATKSVDEIYELITSIGGRWSLIKMLWTHDSDTDNGVRSVYRIKYARALKALINTFKEDAQPPQAPSPAADPTAAVAASAAAVSTRKSKLDTAKLKIFALDPVPGGTAAIRWEHSKFYYLPEDVDCDVYYMAHERSAGFRAVILRDAPNIRKHLLPGNHASASGNFWRQSHATTAPQVVLLGKKDGKEVCSVMDDKAITDKREVVLHHIQDLTLIKLVESLRKSGVTVNATQLGEETAACKKIDGKYESIHKILTDVTAQDLTVEERLKFYEHLQQDLPAYGLLCDGSRDAVYTYHQKMWTGPREVRVRAALSDLTYQTGNLGVLFPVPKGYVNFEHLEVKLEVLRKQLMAGVEIDEPAQSALTISTDESIVLAKIHAIRTLIDRVVRTKLDENDTNAFEGCKQWLGVYVDYTMVTILKNGLSDSTLESIFDTFNYVLKAVSPDVVPPTESQSAPNLFKLQIKKFLQEKAYSLFESRLSEVELRINEFDIDRVRSMSDDTAGKGSSGGASAAGVVSELTALDKFERLQFLVEQYHELCKRTTKFEKYRQQLAAEGLELISSVSVTEYIKKFSEIKKRLLDDIQSLSQNDAGRINLEHYVISVARMTEDIISREVKIALDTAAKEKEQTGGAALSDEEIKLINDDIKTRAEGITTEVTKNIDSLYINIAKISRIEQISVPSLLGDAPEFEIVDEPLISPVKNVVGPRSTVFALWCQSFSRVAAEDLAQTRLIHLERLEQGLARTQEQLKLRQSEIAILNARIQTNEKRAGDDRAQLIEAHGTEKSKLCRARDAAEERVGVLISELDAAKAAAVAAKVATGVAEAATAAAVERTVAAEAATAAAVARVTQLEFEGKTAEEETAAAERRLQDAEAATAAAEEHVRVAQAATAEAQERTRALELERDAAIAATAAAEEQIGVNQVGTAAAVARAERAEAATAAAVMRAEVAENENERYKNITKYLKPTAILTGSGFSLAFGINKVLSFVLTEASVFSSFVSPAAAFTPSSQAVSFGAQLVDTTCTFVANSVASTSIGTLVTVPASVAGTCAAEALTCAAPVVVDTAVASIETSMTLQATYAAQAFTYAAPLITPAVVNTVGSTSGALVAAPVTIAGTCAADALTCAAPFVVDTAVASLEILMTVPARYAVQALPSMAQYAAPAIINTVASASTSALVTGSTTFATCAADALTCAAPAVADTAVVALETLMTVPTTYAVEALTYATPAVVNAFACAAPVVVDTAVASLETLMTLPATYATQAFTYAAPYLTPAVVDTVASTSGTLVAAPATLAGTCAVEALTCAAPAVSSSLSSVLALVPAATNAGVCLAAEAAGVCAAELTASGAIFTSLVTPLAIATGFGGLAALGAVAYYGYKRYQKSEYPKTVKTEEVASGLTTSTSVKFVPEVTLAAPVKIIKPKKVVDDVVEIVPPIDIVIIPPIKQFSAKTEVKESRSTKESTHCKADTIAKDKPITPPAKIISMTPWKLGIYTGFAVTAVVGTTLAVYFVAPLAAPVIMPYVATVQAAIMNFALQHAFLIPVINALTSIANYSSQLAVPLINLLASFTQLLVNLVTANSVTNTVVGVKSLVLTVGSGLAVGAGTAVVAEVSSKILDKLRK